MNPGSRRSKKGLIIILFIILSNVPIYAEGEVSLARQAEQAGQYREALTHYVNALQSASEGSPKDRELREKIIKLSQKIQPPPAMPEDAKRHMARGQGAIKAAKSPEDWADAVKEYEKAVNFAPWYADAYYNLGVARDKAGQFDGAIWALKLYLLAKPYAEDAEQVKNLTYEIEYRKEKAQKEANRKIEEKAKAETSLEPLSGKWKTRLVEWGQRYNRPELTMSSQWARDAGFYVTVTVNKDTFEATAYTEPPVQPWYIYRGNIAGKRIYGTMTDVHGGMEQLCNKGQTTYRFEGEISQQNDAILLIVQGSQLGPGSNCSYDSNSYTKSMRLHR